MTVLEGLLDTAGERPANAYLLLGGSDATAVGARHLAAALMGVDGPARDAVLRGSHADLVEYAPQGARTYLMEQLDDAILPQAGRSPLEARRKVLVLAEAELLGPQVSGALLKTLEEPPPSTSFVLCSIDESGLFDTIVSRCITVLLPPLSHAESVAALAEETGTGEVDAARVLRYAGNVELARHLLSDPGEMERHDRWREVPVRLAREPATSVLRDVLDDVEAAADELSEAYAEEKARIEEHVGDAKVRGRASVFKALEESQKRALRTHRTAEHRLFLTTLLAWFRDVYALAVGAAPLDDRAADPTSPPAQAAATLGPTGTIEVMRAVRRGLDAFEWNVNAELVLEDVLLQIAGRMR